MLTTRRHAPPVIRKLAYGRPRHPLEPHRPAPWLLRGLAWYLGAVVAVLLGLAPLLALVDLQAGAAVLAVAVWLLVGVLVCGFLAGAARPTPIVPRDAQSGGRR